MSETQDILLEIQNLSIQFKLDEGVLKAVDGVSVNLHKGEVLGLVGESGCGKSVTAQSILGLIPKPGTVSGSITLHGDTSVDIAALNPKGKEINTIRGRWISMIFQEEIRDGTSNTMLVAEKDQTLRVGATWTYLENSTSSVGFRPMYAPNSVFLNNNGNPQWDSPQCSRYVVGSMHPGGLNVLFCDGSVQFISETVEAVVSPSCGNSSSRINNPTEVHKYWPGNDAVWQKLYNRKDGRPVTIP